MDDDFEVDFEALDVVSFSLPFAMGCEELVLEFIPMPTPLSLCEELVGWKSRGHRNSTPENNPKKISRVKDGGAQPIHRCGQTANCHPHLHQWHHLRLGSHSQKEKAFQPTRQLSMETTLLDPQWQYPGHLQFRSRLRKSFVHRREQTQREH